MFDEAEDLDTQPYYLTKHESERVVRKECTGPWRVYRPGVVVGHSRPARSTRSTGPTTSSSCSSGRGRAARPGSAVGVEGGEINIVPVDYVAKAMDHIAHQPELDGQAFHLTDPEPKTVGEMINLFAKAADAPQAALRLDSGVTDPATEPGPHAALRTSAGEAGHRSLALAELGIPPGMLPYVNYPTHFDSTNAQAALAGSGIEVPPLETYADRIWDYWERNLDPDLFKDRPLLGRGPRQDGADHRRVVRHRQGGGGEGRRRRRRGASGRPLGDKLEETKREIEAVGGVAHIHRCDMSDIEDVERMAEEVLAYHGHVDILVNNAGRSIRRSVELSYDRFHDYERTMQVNYFGAVRLILALMPAMQARKSGHIINISSIGTQTNPPRFSAYVASKAALDAFARVIASEVFDDGVHITTIHMPLVRTPMIAPTRMYDMFPAITPEEAAEMITRAMIARPKKVATRLGTFGELLYAVAPTVSDKILNTAYKLFPESQAAKGKGEEAPDKPPTTEAVAFAHLMKGVHW